MAAMNLHTCPITGVTITRKCPVTDCLYHSRANKTGCIARDAEELSLEELNLHKGLNAGVSTICVVRKKSVDSIKAVLLVDEFLHWLADTLKPEDYPYVTGYHNRELQRGVIELAKTCPILEIRELKWNIGKVCCALQARYWRDFEKANKLKQGDFLALLGIKQTAANHLLSLFAKAAMGQKP